MHVVGSGLVVFTLDKSNPQFSIRVRAQRFSPDVFYVNEFADRRAPEQDRVALRENRFDRLAGLWIDRCASRQH